MLLLSFMLLILWLTIIDCTTRVCMGLGKPGKLWNFILTFFKTGKSWKKTTGLGKSRKSA